MTKSDFRIEEIKKETVKGRKVKIFSAYKKDGEAFVFVGKFTAPPKTANKHLWLIAAEALEAELGLDTL